MTADKTTPAAASWSVGQLARATGLSVRVLRHWEEMGVLAPQRSAGGQRRYGPAQVTRLYRAVALRRAGFGLGQIAALLDSRYPDPAATLRTHLAQLEEDLRRRGELRDRLAAALRTYDGNRDGDAAALMKVIETMTMFEQYVHGYRAQENLRLHDQASTLVDLLHDGTCYPQGSRVLEAGCGVGAQTVTLARRSPGARLTSIDKSAASLGAARERASAAGVRDLYRTAEDDGVFCYTFFKGVAAAGSLADPGDADERLAGAGRQRAVRRGARMPQPGVDEPRDISWRARHISPGKFRGNARDGRLRRIGNGDRLTGGVFGCSEKQAVRSKPCSRGW